MSCPIVPLQIKPFSFFLGMSTSNYIYLFIHLIILIFNISGVGSETVQWEPALAAAAATSAAAPRRRRDC